MTTNFYDTLSPLEQTYWHQLAEVFALVNPRQPEKGLITMIQRARDEAEQTRKNPAAILERYLKGVRQRTERRLLLLTQCQTS